MEITEEQKKNMLHALGLDYKKNAYRNYYCCYKNHEGWNDLVSKGFAIKKYSPLLCTDDCYFHVSDKGAKFIGVELPNL